MTAMACMASRAMLVAGLLLALLGGQARAFSIASGFGEGCHERITADAFQIHLLDLPFYSLVPPRDEDWRDLSDWVAAQFTADLGPLSDNHRFILVSLFVGVRSPDTDGHSVTDFAALRRLHADPRDEGQYAHALRGIDDDGPAGDAAAIEGTRAIIRARVREALEALTDPEGQLIEAPMYFDFYGRSKVTVWRPMYLLGQAAHALQDSFAHTLRDDASALRRVVHVFNYVEAITSDFDAARDGMRHADSTDDCRRSGELAEAATRATIDLFLATRELAVGRDEQAVEHVLDAWLTLEPGCTADDDFCGNRRWVELARESPTKPYLDTYLGCRSAPGRSAPPWALMAVLLGAFGGIRARRRSSSRP